MGKSSIRALASKIKGHVYSHEIVDAAGRWILKINNQFIGRFQQRAQATEFLRGVITANGGTVDNENDVIDRTKVSYLSSNRIVKERATDLIKRYYHLVYLSINQDEIVENNTGWKDWREMTIRTFVSKPDTANGSAPNWRGSRAFGANNAATDANWLSQFNFTVPNPSVTSPWHNVIYEASWEAYLFGYRAFHYYMPFGCYNETWMLMPMIMEDTFNSTTDPRTCKARVRGFKESIKAMLEGTMVPENGLGPDANGVTRPAITEPCDVHIYLNGITSFSSYRLQSLNWYMASGANKAARDAAFQAYLDRFIQFILDMRGTTPNSGILSITFDVGSFGASPATISKFRLHGDYVSDVVELGEWYVITELRKKGVIVNGEARAPREVSDNMDGYTFDPILSGGHTSGFTSDLEWYYASLPENPNTSEEYLSQDEDFTWMMVMHGSFIGPTWGPYGIKSEITNGANSRNLWTQPHPEGIYSPQHYLRFVYSAADVYADWKWRTNGFEKDWYHARGFRGMACLSIDPYVANNIRCLQPGSGASWGSGSTPAGSATYTWYLTSVGLQGALMNTTWNTATFNSNPSGYTGGLWTTTTAAFYKDNVILPDTFNGPAKSLTLQDWIDTVVADIATNYRFTTDSVNTGGGVCGSNVDDYWKGCVDIGMRS